MDPVVAAIFYVAAFVCFLAAAFSKRFDAVRTVAVGLAVLVVVHGGWDALQAALNK